MLLNYQGQGAYCVRGGLLPLCGPSRFDVVLIVLCVPLILIASSFWARSHLRVPRVPLLLLAVWPRGRCLVPGASVPLSNVNNNSVFPKGVLVSLMGDNIVKAPSRASSPGQGLNNCLALIKDV